MNTSRRNFLSKMFAASVMTAACPHILLGKAEPVIKSGGGNKILGTYKLNLNDFPVLRSLWGTIRLYIKVTIDQGGNSYKHVIITRIPTNIECRTGPDNPSIYGKDFTCVWEVCPHEGNPVENANPDAELYECKKGHGSLFFLNGFLFNSSVTQKNLEYYSVEYDGGDYIYIDFPFYIPAQSDVNEEQTMFYLRQSTPEPCSDYARVEFGLEGDGFVELELYSINGVKVSTISSEWLLPGHYNRIIQTASLPSGIYLIKFSVNSKAPLTQKLIVRH